MEEAGGPSREAHHHVGHSAIQQLEQQGLGIVYTALTDLNDLIGYIEEGPVPQAKLEEIDKAEKATAPPLAIYLEKHSAQILSLNARVSELGSRLSEQVAKLKTLLY